MMAKCMPLSLGNHLHVLILQLYYQSILFPFCLQLSCVSFRWVLQLDREGEIVYSTAPRWINSPTTTSEGLL